MENIDNKSYPRCDILESLIENGVSPALFIGSGISLRYFQEYPDWFNFIVKLAEQLNIDPFQIKTQYQNFLTEGYKKSDALLEVTEFLKCHLDESIKKGNSSNFFTQDEKSLIFANEISPFKYLAAKLFSHPEYKKDLKPHELTELRLLGYLKNNIPYIFTTNFDNFVEYIFPDNKVFISQSDYFYNDNINYAEIYKLHGSYNSPNSMIFTKSDYENFENFSYLSIAKFINIVSERPIIFLGYSLSDPNIINILDKVTNCLQPSQLKKLEKNLIIVNYEKNQLSLNTNKQTINLDSNKQLTLTYINTDNYCRIFYYLSQIKISATVAEIRKLNGIIKKLVKNNSPTIKSVILNLDTILSTTSTEELSAKSKVTAITTSTEGYSKLPLDRLLLDALYDKKEFEPKEILSNWFMRSCSYNINAPIFYYSNRLNLKISLTQEIDKKFNQYKANKTSIIAKLTTIKNDALSKSNWEKEMTKKEKIALRLPYLCYAYHTAGWIEKDNYRKRLQKIYEADTSSLNLQEMKKSILLIDFQ